MARAVIYFSLEGESSFDRCRPAIKVPNHKEIFRRSRSEKPKRISREHPPTWGSQRGIFSFGSEQVAAQRGMKNLPVFPF
jgi:hypothetical protein